MRDIVTNFLHGKTSRLLEVNLHYVTPRGSSEKIRTDMLSNVSELSEFLTFKNHQMTLYYQPSKVDCWLFYL